MALKCFSESSRELFILLCSSVRPSIILLLSTLSMPPEIFAISCGHQGSATPPYGERSSFTSPPSMGAYFAESFPPKILTNLVD
ncbi:hypothetical protein LguiB_003364 [Lonicera macranthoides]